MRVLPHWAEWSDHAALGLTVSQVPVQISFPETADVSRPHAAPPNPVGTPITPSPLDDLLRRTIESRQSLPAALQSLYGAAQCTSRSAPSMYTDGSASRDLGKLYGPFTRAGSGVYWGRGSAKNRAVLAPSPPTNNRAELYAILLAICETDPCLSLRIYTDSDYAIRAICHWAPGYAAAGWACRNADILRNIVDVIRERHAPIAFHWVKGHANNVSNEAADELARIGCA
ncbi:ribonuclease H-like domain-containing protein, partial [Rhodofomes roseus]